MTRDKRTYKPEDIEICGFVIHKIYSQLYPNGLTGAEIKALSRKHGWLKRVYDLVVIPRGI